MSKELYVNKKARQYTERVMKNNLILTSYDIEKALKKAYKAGYNHSTKMLLGKPKPI